MERCGAFPGRIKSWPLSFRSSLPGRDSVHLFYRNIPQTNVIKAFTLISLSISLVFIVGFVVLVSQPNMLLKEVFYEVFSGFGTVGLSLGVTSQLNTLSKSMPILVMYAGRLGPLTLLLVFSRRRAIGKFEYVDENVLIVMGDEKTLEKLTAS